MGDEEWVPFLWVKLNQWFYVQHFSFWIGLQSTLVVFLCVPLASCFILKASHPLSSLVLHFLLVISLHFWSPAPPWCAAPMFVSSSPSPCISVLVFPSALCLTHSRSSSCSSWFWMIDYFPTRSACLIGLVSFIHPDCEFLFNKLFEFSCLLCASRAQNSCEHSSDTGSWLRVWYLHHLTKHVS